MGVNQGSKSRAPIKGVNQEIAFDNKSMIIIDILRFYYKYFTRPNPLPGPIPLPYVGNAFQILYTLFKEGIYQFDLGEYARLQVAKYGEISEVYQGNTRLIYLSRVEYLEKIYSSNTNTI